MATLDSLEPQRRAIIELLLRQGKGYDDLAGMLDMPAGRVRELAQEALVSLAPSKARRVHEDWRGQVADYVLGEQGGLEARATRGHLKRSEPARVWVSSLVDSLDALYGDGARPDIPEPDGGRAARPARGRVGRPSAGAAGSASAATAGDELRPVEPEDADVEETEAEESTAYLAPPPVGASVAARAAAPTRGSTTPAPARERDRAGAFSPEAEADARRRQVVGGALAAAALVAAVALAIALIGGGEESDKGGTQAARSPGSGQTEQAQVRLMGQGRLASVGDDDAEGVAVIAERGGENQLLVQARGLEPSGRRTAYEVWLYNSQRDAVSLGGQVTDQSGSLNGAGPLPQDFRSYRDIDISREKIDRNAEHSGDSVLRVPVSDVLRSAAAAGGTAARPGTPATPGGGAAP